MILIPVMAAYGLFGVGFSVGIWIGDEDIREERWWVRVVLVVLGMVVWPRLLQQRLRDTNSVIFADD
jgi:hypothetical protein